MRHVRRDAHQRFLSSSKEPRDLPNRKPCDSADARPPGPARGFDNYRIVEKKKKIYIEKYAET